MLLSSLLISELFFTVKFMKYFDTHAHLNFPDYNKDRDDLIKRTLEEGVFMINVGTDLVESKKVIELAEKYEKGVYAAVGLHPIYVKSETKEFDCNAYRKLAENKKVIAIGEIGLDYKYIPTDNEEKTKNIKLLQAEVFEKQINLAKDLDLPIIVHSRMAHKDTIEILKGKSVGGVIHCFSGNRSDAKEYLELGFFLGINGIIFKMNLEKVIKEISLENILLETDCPFLSPIKEEKRNEPLFIRYIAKEVARIKELDVDEVLEITTNNARNLFNL